MLAPQMPDRRPQPAARGTGPAGKTSRDGEPQRILLVEDDDADATIFAELLREVWPAVAIRRAGTIREALAHLPGEVDAVVLDLALPDALGIEAVRRVRDADTEMPIVVLTGDTGEGRGIEALGAGAQDYLVKGAIDGAGLARAIRHSVQRKLAERFARELAVLRVQTAENARVQRGLVPRPLVDDPRIEIHSAYRPGNRRQVLGGDFFDVVQSSDTRLELMLGDVCGRGPDEAALGVELRIAWRTLILADVAQRQLLRILDRVVTQERHADHIFATLATVTLDLARGIASVALAGHPPPIVARGTAIELLTDEAAGQPLGVARPPEWQLVEVGVPAPFSLLLYSDGIYEGRVGATGPRLGIDGLLGVVAEAPPETADRGYASAPEQLIDRVEALNEGPLEDDVALLALTCDVGFA